MENIGEEVEQAARPPRPPIPHSRPVIVESKPAVTLEQKDDVLDASARIPVENLEISRGEISDAVIPASALNAPIQRIRLQQRSAPVIAPTLSNTRLREGIVLAEILAPPIALRD
jgi:hypothetical protein